MPWQRSNVPVRRSLKRFGQKKKGRQNGGHQRAKGGFHRQKNSIFIKKISKLKKKYTDSTNCLCPQTGLFAGTTTTSRVTKKNKTKQQKPHEKNPKKIGKPFGMLSSLTFIISLIPNPETKLNQLLRCIFLKKPRQPIKW